MRISDWSSDVCSSDLVVARGTLGDGRGEGVEVDDDKVDAADAMRVHRGDMALVVAHREDAAVDGRVQRLDAAVHHLGKARQVGDIAHGMPRLEQGSGERRLGKDGVSTCRSTEW